jgi:hypothetical protein
MYALEKDIRQNNRHSVGYSYKIYKTLRRVLESRAKAPSSCLKQLDVARIVKAQEVTN